MKHLFYILTVLFGSFAFSQNYKADLDLEVKANGGGSYGDGCRNDINVVVVFTDNTELTLLSQDLNGVGRNVYVNFTNIKDYNISKDVDKVVVRTSRNWRRRIGGCGGNGSFDGSPVENSVSFCDNSFDEFSDGNDDNDIARWWDVRFDLNFYPVIAITDPLAMNSFPTDDNILVQSTPGYRYRDYNWEYSLDLSTWISINNFEGSSEINASIQDILSSSDIDLMHGQDIYFRINTCGDRTTNEVTYIIRKSAPHITSTTQTPTSCFDAKDGTATIQFDRPLKRNELLSIALEKYNEIDGVYEAFAPDMDGDDDPNTNPLNNITSLEPDNSFLIFALPHGQYKVGLSGFYNSFSTYTDGAQHTATFTITRPTPVEFTTSKVNVWCNGGEDGEIAINAMGGTGAYEFSLDEGNTWQAFNNGANHQLTELAPATYTIQVRDTNLCISKEIVTDGSGNIVGLGDPIIQTIEITEPDAPVAITYTYSQEPTAFGFNNGLIVAQITAGTPLLGGVYNYTWTYEDGTIWTDITEEVTADGYTLTLNNAPAGVYTLTVTDANYNNATDKDGCTVQESEFELTQPEPLQVVLSVKHEISCHQDNEFGNETDTAPQDGQRDESQDGAILATVTGGVQFSSGEPYIYTWKKQLADGSWQILTNQTENIAVELSDANYAFNVKDANGNILGVYQNNTLQEVTDSIFYLAEPPKLELSLSSTPTTCASGSNGSVTASVTGGTPPYTYYWSNGETGNLPALNNLAPNNYFVQIVDAKGCQVQGSIEIQQPDDYYIEVAEQINPTCFAGSNGKINLSVVGGTAPYIYSWNTGATTEDLNNLEAGTYTVTITDASGCILYQEFELENPEEITIDLGRGRTLCNAQSLLLDATINDSGTTYQWTSDNGFTSTNPQIQLSQAGTYQVTATTSLGCVVQDEITITTSNQEIDSEFLISSQAFAGEEVILVNVSNPIGQTTEWLIPSEVSINQQNQNNIQLVFPEVGTYEVGLRSTQGACFQEYYKNIVVEQSSGLPNPGDTDNPFIKEFILTPNPNNGTFEIRIKLAEQSPVSVRIFNYVGEIVSNPRNESGSDTYSLNFNETMATGTYLVVLETAKGTQVKRMIRF